MGRMDIWSFFNDQSHALKNSVRLSPVVVFAPLPTQLYYFVAVFDSANGEGETTYRWEPSLKSHSYSFLWRQRVTVSFSTSIRISFPVPIPHFPFLTFEPCFGSVFVFIADLDPDPAQNLNVFFRIHATGTCWCRLRMMDKKLLRF